MTSDIYKPQFAEDPWDVALRCDALYECPKDASGKRLGPLVPYAGKDELGRNLVGDVYFNFAAIEEQPWIVRFYALHIVRAFKGSAHAGLLNDALRIVGIPDGGRSLAQALAEHLEIKFAYPAKVPRPKPSGAVKEEFDLIFKRMDIPFGAPVIVVDDVHNNFQNTDDALDAVEKAGGRVVALCSALNRSPHVDDLYVPKKGLCEGRRLPVVSAIRKPLLEYRQDDPEVAEDVRRGNIEANVKAHWPRLKKVMDDHRRA